MTTDRQVAYAGRDHLRRYTFVPALRIGDLVWISGTTATDETNAIVGADIVEQTRTIFGKFEALLNELGGTCRDIVQTTDYFVTTEKYGGTAQVRREVFGDSKPTSTGVQVAGLLRPGALIEISAMAVLPGKRERDAG
jgi:enamine deaminase RidA (YjgF/YER057c/UK114 family)